MNLKDISNENLDKNLQLLVHRERELLSEILMHICEADRRKLYLELAYPNLFSYMTEHLKYSAGSAQRRIDAARLSHEVPEIMESLESGSLNLSQVSMVQRAIRQVFKESHLKVSCEQKHDLLSRLEGKSFEESQVIVARSFDIEIQVAPKVQHQADESVRLEVSFSQEKWAKMEEMRNLLSHSLPSGSWEEVFEYLADKIIQQKSKTKDLKSKVGPEVLNTISSNNVGKYVSGRTSREVFQRDRCCQFQDRASGKKCTSKWQLQIDHIKPIWAGGGNSLDNLQLLCSQHNQDRYRKQAGIRA